MVEAPPKLQHTCHIVFVDFASDQRNGQLIHVGGMMILSVICVLHGNVERQIFFSVCFWAGHYARSKVCLFDLKAPRRANKRSSSSRTAVET